MVGLEAWFFVIILFSPLAAATAYLQGASYKAPVFRAAADLPVDALDSLAV